MDFIEPKNLPEAESRRLALVQQALDIQQQLTAKKVVGYVSDQEWREYNDWRKKATAALTVKQREMAFLKAWVKRQNVTQAAQRSADAAFSYDPNDALSLLVAAAKALCRVYSEVGWEDVEPEEQQLLDAIRAHCNARGVHP